MPDSLPFPSNKPGPRTRRAWLPWVLGGLVVTALIFGLWPRPQPVEIGIVQRGTLQVTVEDEGVTRIIHRYVVAAPVSGQLQRIDLKPGAAVEANRTVLATLESSAGDLLDATQLTQALARRDAARANRDAASAQATRAKAGHDLAVIERDRIKSLWDRQAVSHQEFDAAEMKEVASNQDLRTAEFALQVAAFELRQAEAELQRGRAPTRDAQAADDWANVMTRVEITSPVTGRVLRVFQESARRVAAGLPLLEIGDPSDLELRIEVLSRDAVAIKPGARVWLEQWGGAEPLEARVRLIEPSAFTKISALGVEEQRVYVIADFTGPPALRTALGDAYRVEARIVVWEKADTLLVPAGALYQKGGETRAYLQSGGRARERKIEPGRTNGIVTEVLSGLQAGDAVVVYPGDKISDGSRIRGLDVGSR